MRSGLAVLLILLAGLVGGPHAATPVRGRLFVFAAASLTDAFGEVGRVLERENPGLRVTFNFAASSALRTQILQGARADVFASVDERNMQVNGPTSGPSRPGGPPGRPMPHSSTGRGISAEYRPRVGCHRILLGPTDPGVGPCGGGAGIHERRAQTLSLAIMTPLGSNPDAALALSALFLLPSPGRLGGVRLLSASRGVFAW